MSEKSMTSAKPYLIRAIYEWLADNDCTPYVHIDATIPNVEVPTEYIKDQSITLDISAAATIKLLIDNHSISFNASFGGTPHELYIPISAVRAIYAPENGQGMSFPEDEYPDDDFAGEIESTPKKSGSPFTVIEGDK